MRRKLIILGLTIGLLVMVGGASAQAFIRFETRTLEIDGMEREYQLFVPRRYDAAEPVPLVFVLHGGGGSPDQAERAMRFGEKARDEGFILVYPAGTGSTRKLLTWNAMHCCGYAYENQVDDVGFFRAMLDTLKAEFSIDPGRIYVAGHSNGGMMTYRLAAELSDVFAAAASVAGTIGGRPTPESDEIIQIPAPEYPLSILHIHGMADVNVAYEGGINEPTLGDLRIDLSVKDTIAFWLDADQCNPTPSRDESDDAMVITETYACPKTETAVRLIAIVDGLHPWPGDDSNRRDASQRLSATDVIWAFFAEHPKPE